MTYEHKTPYERVLLHRMTTNEGMGTVVAAGVRVEIFEESRHRYVFDWMVDYWRMNAKEAPPLGILAAEFPDVSFEPGDTESTTWIIDHLNERWAANTLQEILRRAVTAPKEDPITTMDVLSAEISNARAVINEMTQEPIPMAKATDVPPFPVDAFPVVFATMVTQLAEATQTDPAMAAMSVLSVLSTCTGGRARIQIRRGWQEQLCLYCITVASSGERKSTVQERLVAPIRVLERQLKAETNVTRLNANAQKQHLTKRAERAHAAAASRDTSLLEEAMELTRAAEEIVVPPSPRLLADDITPEAAASLLVEQGGQLAIISAEGGLFDIIAGRYGSSTNLELWLKGHPGDPLRVDRKGRDPEYVQHPALTLGLMLQPSMLTYLSAHPEFRDRGFMARFLYAMPDAMAGRREVGTQSVDPVISEIYDESVIMIARDLMDRKTVAVLMLDDDAAAEFHQIQVDIEPTLAPDGELGTLVDWGSKFAGAIARLAGILHFAEYGALEGAMRPVGVLTIKAAARMGEYFRATAISAFTEMGRDPVTVNAIYLLDRIRQLGLEEVSERDLMRAARRFKTVSELRSVIYRLIDHGYLFKIPVTEPIAMSSGRPAVLRYRVHSSVPRAGHDQKSL